MMRRIAPFGLAVLLAGAAVFFAVQNLSRADQYASVGSFLLALAVAGGGVVLHLRRGGSPAARETPAPETGSAGPASPTNTIMDAGVVFTGPGARADITFTGDGARRRRRK
jgi:hypothetical protein